MADVNDLSARVRASRSAIEDLANGKKDLAEVGGMEAFAAHMTVAAMDKNRNGQLDSAELQAFEEATSKMVDRTIQMCLNSGVVSALLLSILYPFAFESIEASDDSRSFFGHNDTIITALIVINDLLLLLMIAANLMHIMASVYILTTLLSWLPQLEHQQWWLAHNTDLLMFVQVIIPSTMIIFMAVLPIPAGLLLAPHKGFIALAVLVCVLIFNTRVLVRNQAGTRALQFAQAKSFCGMTVDDIPRKLWNHRLLKQRAQNANRT